MLSYKSFVDMLFILLLGTMVMLSQSVQIGALDTVMAKLGSRGISSVRADEVQVIVIDKDGLRFEGETWEDIEQLAERIRADDPVLLVTADREVRHHQVMAIWMALRHRELDVKLGAQPSSEAAPPGKG